MIGIRIDSGGVGRLDLPIDQKEFVAERFTGGEVETGGIGESSDTGAVADGGGEGAAEDERAPGEVQFVDEVGLEEGVIESAASFDHDGADVEVTGEGQQAGVEIDGVAGGNEDVIGEGLERLGAVAGCGIGDPEVDGGEPVLPEMGGGRERGGSGDDDADGVRGEAGGNPGPGEFIAAIAQGGPGFLHRACAAEDGIGGGAEFMEMPGIVRAAEGMDGA